MKRYAVIILLAIILTAFGGMLNRGQFAPVLAENETAAVAESLLEEEWEARWEMDGIYGPTEGLMSIDGNVLMTVAGVQLQNMVVNGNMYVDVAAGSGSIELNNITVAGRLIVRGDAESEEIVLTDSQVNTLVLAKSAGTVEVRLQGHSAAWSVRVESAAVLKEGGAGIGFGHIYYNSIQPLALQGEFKTLSVENSGGIVALESGRIGKIYIESKAKDSQLTLADKSQVDILELFAPVKVSGSGTVALALVKTDGSELEKAPQAYEFAAEKTITVAGRLVDENTAAAPEPQKPAAAPEANNRPQQPAQPAKPSVTLNKADNLTLEAGKTATRSFTANPADAVLAVSSSNSKVAAASLSAGTVTVTAHAGGTATVTVTATKEGFAAAKTSFTVTVKAPPPPVAVGNVQTVEHQPMFGMASIRIWLNNTASPEKHTVTVFGNRCNYNSAGYFEFAVAMDDELAKKTAAEIRAATKID